MSAKLEKLLIEAEDCEIIGRLATDVKKRELFQKLAADSAPWPKILRS